MYKSFKYRIYPTAAQKFSINQNIYAARYVYNLALETKIYAYKAHGVSLSGFDLINEMKSLKKDFPWLAYADSQSLNKSILNMDDAFKRFFSGSGFPVFKKKQMYGSFSCPCNKREVDFNAGTVSIPKIKKIKAKLSQHFQGKIKTITISSSASGKYFATVLVEIDVTLPKIREVKENTSVGIDVGIKDLAITSNGLVIPNNKYLKKSLQRLKVLQKRASKKKKGSNNRKKANLKVALLYEKITNQRKDQLHKSVNKIISDSQADTIFIEDLNIKGMIKNHKLAQALSDVSIGEFYRILGYKCEWKGINLIKIGRFDPSSKRCFECGEINHELTLADRTWTCVNGHLLDRDLNAAKNIKYFGLNNI